jgi:hypothetical protein
MHIKYRVNHARRAPYALFRGRTLADKMVAPALFWSRTLADKMVAPACLGDVFRSPSSPIVASRLLDVVRIATIALRLVVTLLVLVCPALDVLHVAWGGLNALAVVLLLTFPLRPLVRLVFAVSLAVLVTLSGLAFLSYYFHNGFLATGLFVAMLNSYLWSAGGEIRGQEITFSATMVDILLLTAVWSASVPL